MKKQIYIGIDNSGDRCSTGKHMNVAAMKKLGIDFVVNKYHVESDSVKEELSHVPEYAKEFEDNGFEFILNVETGNWSESLITEDGYDWVTRPDGNHLFMFPAEMLDEFSKSSAFLGVMYDELEHSQITRNISLTLRNPKCDEVSLGETTGLSFEEANRTVFEHSKKLVDSIISHGVHGVYTEHVWPVLFHNFAKAGITPVYKQMKENWSNVWAACAVGAALQYGCELWACLDFWNKNTFPGHSPEELWGNMLFAYWSGTDRFYIESVNRRVYTVENNDIVLHEYGDTIRSFTTEYVPQHQRDYTFRDYEPATAIIRFDDTEWGQGENHYCEVEEKGERIHLYWTDWLFGSKTLKTSPESEEWMKAWNTITHGEVSELSLSWNYEYPYRDKPHRSFAPAYAPVVFDDTVTKDKLGTLRLAFLCGLRISGETLRAVGELVREKGLTVVTSPRFAPEELASKYTDGTFAFDDGKGRWIITDNMASAEVKKELSSLLGKNNEIVYRFKNGRHVIFKIAENGDKLEVERNFR